MAKPLPVTVGTYWINDYKKPPACGVGTDLTQTKYCDDLASRFMGAMRSHGHQAKVNRSEGAASPRHWRGATDGDPNGVDTVDFAFLATHGGTGGKEMPGPHWVHWVVATFNSHDSHDGCRVFTREFTTGGSPTGPAMQLGDGSLRWVVLDLCGSLQVGHVNEKNLANAQRANELRDATPGGTWTPCWAGVHIIFGFTGESSDAWWTRDRGARFGGRAGRGDALAESWLDEAHSHVCDDAPVVVAWGRSPKDADRRLNAESLSRPEPTLAPSELGGCSWMWRV
jgi:hypothetical protein